MDEISGYGRSGGAANPRPAHDLTEVGQSKRPSPPLNNPLECPTAAGEVAALRAWADRQPDETICELAHLLADHVEQGELVFAAAAVEQLASAKRSLKLSA